MTLALVSGAPPALAAAVGILAALSGSIPTGLLLTRLTTGRDVRSEGSGNIGAANVSRVAGARVGSLVLSIDLLKGLLPVLLAKWLGLNPIDLAIISGLAVLGHDFSVFLRFHGGKGVATTLGVAAGLAFLPAAAAALVWVLVAAGSRISAAASLAALWALPLLMAVFDQPPEYVCVAFGLSVLGFYTHRENIARLARRQETRIGRRV